MHGQAAFAFSQKYPYVFAGIYTDRQEVYIFNAEDLSNVTNTQISNGEGWALGDLYFTNNDKLLVSTQDFHWDNIKSTIFTLTDSPNHTLVNRYFFTGTHNITISMDNQYMVYKNGLYSLNITAGVLTTTLLKSDLTTILSNGEDSTKSGYIHASFDNSGKVLYIWQYSSGAYIYIIDYDNLEANLYKTLSSNTIANNMLVASVGPDRKCIFSSGYSVDVSYEQILTSFTRKGIKYVNTSDATATADDLALNKTAYINGIKLEGNVDTVASDSMTSGRFLENSPYLAVCSNRDLLLRTGGAIEITEEQIADKGNITPDKIVKGNTIFGVEGTAETGTKINNQDKDITKNGTYTADEGYTGLGTVIVNVPQTGDVPVKLFKTKDEMNSSTGNVEGDLALVYKNEIQPITEESEFDSCTFPQTVVLKEAFTDDIYGRFRAVDSSSGRFDGNCMLDKNSFRFDGFGDTMVRVQYTSSDGITYTRTDGGEELQEFGTVIKYEPMEPWNNVIGNFMKIGGNHFEGIYTYKNNSWQLAPTQLTATSDYVYEQLLFYGKNGLESGTLGIPDNSFADSNAEVYNKIQTQYNNMTPRILADDDKTIDQNIYCIPVKRDGTPLLDTSSVTNMHAMFQDCSKLTAIPLLNTSKVTDMHYMFNGCTNLTTISLLDTSRVIDISWMFNGCTNLTTIPELDTSSATNMNTMFASCTNLTTIPELNTGKVTNMGSMFNDCKNLTAIPLLNTSKVTNMAYMFTSCTNLTTIPELDTSSVTTIQGMFNNCKKLTAIPLLNTSNATNMSSMFNGCSSLTTIPELDTSSVTDMTYMFSGCTNLTKIPLLNTSKVTNMYGMFDDCKNLATIPLLDTSNVTGVTYMFAGCSNLTTIPELNTSKITGTYGMFNGCSSLTTIPKLDTSNAAYMDQMFYGCTNLTTIPLLDTSKVTSISDMFGGCSSLSDDSLNIIMQMCINATSYTGTKTLKYIGLTSEQADKCTTLSNYSAFTFAGWTTGY